MYSTKLNLSLFNELYKQESTVKSNLIWRPLQTLECATRNTFVVFNKPFLNPVINLLSSHKGSNNCLQTTLCCIDEAGKDERTKEKFRPPQVPPCLRTGIENNSHFNGEDVPVSENFLARWLPTTASFRCIRVSRVLTRGRSRLQRAWPHPSPITLSMHLWLETLSADCGGLSTDLLRIT